LEFNSKKKRSFKQKWIPSKFIFKCDNGNCYESVLLEFKKTDYFLNWKKYAWDDEYFKIRAILNTIDSISAVYTVDADQIKSKNNLILIQMISNKKTKL
jgi:hypothetical protein